MAGTHFSSSMALKFSSLGEVQLTPAPSFAHSPGKSPMLPSPICRTLSQTTHSAPSHPNPYLASWSPPPPRRARCSPKCNQSPIEAASTQLVVAAPPNTHWYCSSCFGNSARVAPSNVATTVLRQEISARVSRSVVFDLVIVVSQGVPSGVWLRGIYHRPVYFRCPFV